MTEYKFRAAVIVLLFTIAMMLIVITAGIIMMQRDIWKLRMATEVSDVRNVR